MIVTQRRLCDFRLSLAAADRVGWRFINAPGCLLRGLLHMCTMHDKWCAHAELCYAITLCYSLVDVIVQYNLELFGEIRNGTIIQLAPEHNIVQSVYGRYTPEQSLAL